MEIDCSVTGQSIKKLEYVVASDDDYDDYDEGGE